MEIDGGPKLIAYILHVFTRRTSYYRSCIVLVLEYHLNIWLYHESDEGMLFSIKGRNRKYSSGQLLGGLFYALAFMRPTTNMSRKKSISNICSQFHGELVCLCTHRIEVLCS